MEQLSAAVMEIAKCLWKPLKEHATYLLCYSRKINKLETQVGELEWTRRGVQQTVDAASERGETILDNVQQWLTKVDAVKSEVESMAARSADVKCWKGWCWNPVLCYGLGKEAAKKVAAVDELRNKSNFERVSRSPSPPTTESLLPSSGFQPSASTETPMRSVLNALKDDGIQIIGVHGMGGVGKTTLMKEVAKQVEQDNLFDKVVMVTVSQNVIIKKIQEEIGEQLGFTIVAEGALVRAARLSARLKEVAKILVILDDLWEGLELNDAGIPCGDQHRGCKVVITTRNSDVCNAMESQRNIEMKPLSNDDSWDLFLKKAGPEANSPELNNVARKIVGECKGLPLAIIVLGSSLRGKSDVTIWRTILNQLERSEPIGIHGMEKQVFQSIKVSFDHLEVDEAKLCFLFCCLFPEDKNIHFKDVTRIMVGEGKIPHFESLEDAENKVYLLLDNLKASGLLLEGDVFRKVTLGGKEVFSGNEGLVKMHDIVRDVAIWIASKEPYGFYSRAGVGLTEWPSRMDNKIQRISLMGNNIRVLPEVPPSFPNLCTLLLPGNEGLETIPDGFFSEIKALQVLDLSLTRISSLSTSFSCLTNLRVLLLLFCPSFHNLSGIGALKSLEILQVTGQYEQDYEECKDALPAEVGELINLRRLKLPFSFSRIPQNVISRLSKLEEVDLPDCHKSKNMSSAPFAELACLPRLRKLVFRRANRECFLQDLGPGAFNNLVDFSVCILEHENHGKEGNQLSIITLMTPTWAERLLPKTDELFFQFCPEMECLVGANGGNFPNGAFCNVKSIRLFYMMDLCEICRGAPPEYGFLGNLTMLLVGDCHKLTKIFSFDLISRVEQLETLEVYRCNQLLCVFQNNGAAGGCRTPMGPPKLESVYLYYLPSLVSVWEGDMPLKSLRKLSLRSCNTLTYLFSWRQVQSLESLEELYIVDCPGMVAIIMSDQENSKQKAIKHDTSTFPKLRKIFLESLKIMSFDAKGAALFDWPSLDFLYVTYCPNLKKIPLSPNGGQKLRRIQGSEEWFQALEWDDENNRSRLQTLFS